MKTPADGDQQQTGLGQRVEPKKPEPKPIKRDMWEPIHGRPGYERHVATGDVRRST